KERPAERAPGRQRVSARTFLARPSARAGTGGPLQLPGGRGSSWTPRSRRSVRPRYGLATTFGWGGGIWGLAVFVTSMVNEPSLILQSLQAIVDLPSISGAVHTMLALLRAAIVFAATEMPSAASVAGSKPVFSITS